MDHLYRIYKTGEKMNNNEIIEKMFAFENQASIEKIHLKSIFNRIFEDFFSEEHFAWFLQYLPHNNMRLNDTEDWIEFFRTYRATIKRVFLEPGFRPSWKE